MRQETSPVAQLMTSGVFTVTPDTPVREAAESLLEMDVGSLVVVDEDNRPVGMLTNTDLVEILSRGDVGDDTTVAQYMTNEIITISTRSSIREAAAKMINNRIHHLPVTDEGNVVGMLSTMDLTSYLSYTAGADAE